MNVLQGFRALSANLAVELPEAPHGESLYRTLFLSALLLFGFTFLINTLAEVVRVRGRKAL
jgi:phosphate transport system permease protein